MARWLHVVRHFLGGPLDGNYVEAHERPAPWLGVMGGRDGLLHRYVLTGWRMPEATYTYCGPEIPEEASFVGESH